MSKRIALEAKINEDPAKKSRKCYTIEYKMKLLKEVKDSNISAKRELLLLLVLLCGTYLSCCVVSTFLFYFFATFTI